MERPVVVGIDIGTTKICTLIARVEDDRNLRILGVGIEPSLGVRHGTIIDLASATQSISRSIEKAERSSGLEIASALVSLAGSHVSSINSRGVVAISGRVIDQEDVNRALEAAQAVAIPHNREIIHVIQRSFSVDGQEGVRMPIGMHGYRLEVEAHIITAAAATVENIRQCVEEAGVQVQQFVLNPLASGEVVLTETEREMGTVICDIGGGTTDMAIYIEGDVWHTMVLAVGGNHITSDIAHGLRLPISQAEEIKKEHGHAVEREISDDQILTIRSFGEDEPIQYKKKDLAFVIEARAEEIFQMVLQEIKRSGYDGLLPAGMVLTGGTSNLPGIKHLASQTLGLPVRIAQPENMVGLVDQINSPAFSTSVGLLNWALIMSESTQRRKSSRIKSPKFGWDNIKGFLRRLLP